MAYLGEVEAKALLAQEGLPVNPTFEVRDLGEALEKADFLGYPVVLKVSSGKIVHKSDVGGVVLGISSALELEGAFRSLEEKMKALDPQAAFSIQPHVSSGLELVVGITTDPSFGRVIMFGLGGIWVEVLKDVSFRLVPIEEGDALEMIEELKGKKLLEGFRGIPPVDKEALARFLFQVSSLAQARNIGEMDLNPVMVTKDGPVIVDARVVVEDEGQR